MCWSSEFNFIQGFMSANCISHTHATLLQKQKGVGQNVHVLNTLVAWAIDCLNRAQRVFTEDI